MEGTFKVPSIFIQPGGASLKTSVSRKLPAFAKLAVCVYEKMRQEQVQDQRQM